MSDAFRWFLVCGGMMQLGFNGALWKHVPRLVPSHVGAWRLFVAAHTGLVVFAVDSLHHRIDDPLGWPVAVVSVSGVAALLSFVVLERSLRTGERVRS